MATAKKTGVPTPITSIVLTTYIADYQFIKITEHKEKRRNPKKSIRLINERTEQEEDGVVSSLEGFNQNLLLTNSRASRLRLRGDECQRSPYLAKNAILFSQ